MRKAILAGVLLTLGACTGEDGLDGLDGKNGLVSVIAEPEGANCPTGGRAIRTGLDQNANGALDEGEITSTEYVCNGAPGQGEEGLATVFEDEPIVAGDSRCPTGGTLLHHGLDLDSDGELDLEERAGAVVVCNGEEGGSGEQGAATVFSQERLAAGDSRCPSGGTALHYGLDQDGDLELDPNEATGTVAVCDGAPGAATVFGTEPLPEGDSHCPAGGIAFSYGLDEDQDASLDADEIQGTEYLCRIPRTCGDGVPDALEQCDDGNQVAGDGCENDCTVTGAHAACGNSLVESGEACDDGNQVAGDGCENDCTITVVHPVCGNGALESGEACDDGNQTAGDGCENDCTLTGQQAGIRECGAIPANTSGRTCEVTAGSEALLIKGTILVPGTVFRGGQVLVGTDGKIACVDCDCSAQAAGATVVSCPDAVVSPGLINAHDHITFANNEPYVAPADKADERFEHRHDWRKGLRGHTHISVNSYATAQVKSHLELRFVAGGATSIVGSGSAPGLMRNLDVASAQLGLNQDAVDYETFPLEDSNGTLLSEGCNYSSSPIIESAGDAYFPHVAEGIDREAHNEFLCLESTEFGGTDIVKPNAAFIHGVGALPPDAAWMALDGTKLIWSARTNISLYGDTAPVTMYARAGAVIALGTDWIRSGSTSMLRELRCVADLNETYFDHYFSDEEIWKMATVNAARAAAMDDVIGILAPGKVADIAIFRRNGRIDHRAVIDAEPIDVTLVLRAGKALYGDDNLVGAIGNVGGCSDLDVCGVQKSACTAETGATLAQLQAAGDQYSPLVYCNDAPPNEPTCLPARTVSVKGSTVYDGLPKSGDQDGDGIADASDNCPTVFNPIRPLDDGHQADMDGDGVGDVCDACPISAAGGACPAFTPGDYDMDGVADDSDNCVALANADQANTDGDARGNACDSCPNDADPCPAPAATIYDIKRGIVADGEVVRVSQALVTAVGTGGYFVQVKEGDAGFAGADFSGIYVYTGTSTPPTVAVGDRVDLNPATVDDYYGQIELRNVTAAVTASGEAAPAPVVVATPCDLATTGSRHEALEGVLVQVENVAVTSANPDAPTNNGEFEVAGCLRVNDLFYATTPAPVVGDQYDSISGVLDWRNNDSKIEPRSAADLVLGDAVATLASISPSFGYVRAGTQDAQTFPAPMMVSLVRSVETDTLITVTSGASGDLEIVGGSVIVPAGQTEAPILFNANNANASVAISATLGGTTLDAAVRVLGDAEAPTLVELTPATASAAPGASKTMTVTVDLPAPAGGTVVTLAQSPIDGGTMPASVTVPENEVSATFDFVAGSNEGEVTLTATLGAASDSAVVTIGVAPQSSTLIFSEYVEGGSNNKAFEIYNGTGADVDLSTCTVKLYTNGSSSAGSTLAMQGTLAAGAVYSVCNSQAAPALLALCDMSHGIAGFNGNDVLELSCNGAVVDVIGQIGFTGTEWAANGVSTLNQTLRRKCSVTAGDTDGSDAFDPSIEWETFAQDTFDGIGSHTCL